MYWVFRAGKDCPTVKAVVSMDPISDEAREKHKETCPDVKLYTFEEFEKLGEENPSPPSPPKADDIAVIMYV
tara:strand:+ start:456 stop:671 length:216 start_codon:yes stop_codon:yes gene_type:complete